MPSVLHEALRELFATSPELLAPLRQSRLALPSATLVPVGTELTEPRMTQLLPDAVLACPSVQAPRVVVIVEGQLGIADVKRKVWPQYAATAHGRFGCRVELVVVTADREVERWARRPIRIGRRHAMVPDVVGPSSLPLLRRDEVERAPALAMLSTLAHMDDDASAQQALWTFEALSGWGGDADGRLADILQAALTVAVRDKVEDLMRTGQYEYKSDFAKKYFAQGREEGRAAGQVRALLLVLESRGVAVDSVSEQRIRAQRDESRLDAWLRRAVTAANLDEVFAER